MTTTNIQLTIDKIKTEKARVNLEANKARLFGKKNSLIAKREELRTKIVALNITGPLNVLIYGYQNLFLKPIQDKFKAKKLSFFDGLKENLQGFFTKTRYYQGFYQQSLPFDFNKI